MNAIGRPSLAILTLLLRLTFPSPLSKYNDQCPSETVCRDDSGHITRNNISFECCSPCSCADACTITGICCPGKINTSRSTPTFPCRQQSQIYERHLNRSAKFVGGQAYRVIDECSVGYERLKGTEEVISRCKRAKVPVDLIFVTGRQSGLTYLNEHCARCNGEYDFMTWNLYLTDRGNNLIFSSFKERDDILLKRGSFKVAPPTAQVAILSFCKTDSISRCNVTGLWNYYDKDLEANCMSYHNYFSINYRNKRYTFLNIYCYLCNFGINILRHCVISDEIRETFDLTETVGRVLAFNALVIPSKETSDISVPVQKTCSSGEFLDNVLNRCTPLICPPGTIPDHGICQPAMKQVTGYVVLLRLELKIDSNVHLQPGDYRVLLTELGHFTKTITRKRGMECGVCERRILKLQDKKIVWEQQIHSGEKCDHVVLLENMFLAFKAFPIVVFSENLNCNVTVSYSITDGDYSSVKTLGRKSNAKICNVNIVYAPTVVHCPSLIFNKTNVSGKCNDSCFNTKIIPFSFHLGNGTYIICSDRYRKVFSSKHQTLINGFDKSVMSIPLGFYSLIHLMHIQMYMWN